MPDDKKTRKPRSEDAKKKIAEGKRKHWESLKNQAGQGSYARDLEQQNKLLGEKLEAEQQKVAMFIDLYINYNSLIKEMLDIDNKRVKGLAQELMKIGRSYGLDLD